MVFNIKAPCRCISTARSCERPGEVSIILMRNSGKAVVKLQRCQRRRSMNFQQKILGKKPVFFQSFHSGTEILRFWCRKGPAQIVLYHSWLVIVAAKLKLIQLSIWTKCMVWKSKLPRVGVEVTGQSMIASGLHHSCHPTPKLSRLHVNWNV